MVRSAAGHDSDCPSSGLIVPAVHAGHVRLTGPELPKSPLLARFGPTAHYLMHAVPAGPSVVLALARIPATTPIEPEDLDDAPVTTSRSLVDQPRP